jgi:glycosyltransferase involved in cell wall biosynthesis
LYITDQGFHVHSGNSSCNADDVDSVQKGSEFIDQIIQKMTNRTYFDSALLNINIQGAREDERSVIALALNNLLVNTVSKNGGCHNTESPDVLEHGLQKAKKTLQVLFLCPESGEIPPRIVLASEVMSSLGFGTDILFNLPLDSLGNFNVVCVHNPHVDVKNFEEISKICDPNTAIVLDLDADYEQMPVDHPDYERMGLCTASKAMAYISGLLYADSICVPNKYFASQLQNNGCRVEVIPDGWSKENALWDKPSELRNTINIGWIGLPCQLDDATPIRRIVTRVLNEFPQARFVVGGGPEVYRMFESLPEGRRLFLPIVNYEDYPYLISQIDVLISPLSNRPYNRTLTDRWIMEAGVRRIPWIASPLPAVLEWGVGGLVANSVEELYTRLRQLVLDQNLRESLGSQGRQRSEERELNKLGDLWFHLVWDLWHEKQNNC